MLKKAARRSCQAGHEVERLDRGEAWAGGECGDPVEATRLDPRVGVEEHEHLTRRHARAGVARPLLARPAGREGRCRQDPSARRASNASGAVRRVVVDHQHLVACPQHPPEPPEHDEGGHVAHVLRTVPSPISRETPTSTYDVGMLTPASVRFSAAVAERLSRFVASHPGLSASAATNLLVDEALRCQEHPLVVFRDGPAGRRARLIGGPDVWEVVHALRSARTAEPELDPEGIVAMVGETSGVEVRLVRAAIDYWAAFPEEIDGWLERAEAESTEAERRWRREQQLLGR